MKKNDILRKQATLIDMNIINFQILITSKIFSYCTPLLLI